MGTEKNVSHTGNRRAMSRRRALELAAGAGLGAALSPVLGAPAAAADESSNRKETTVTPKAFVYTELQISVPFDQAP